VCEIHECKNQAKFWVYSPNGNVTVCSVHLANTVNTLAIHNKRQVRVSIRRPDNGHWAVLPNAQALGIVE
jgi:hypothetical protein